MSESTAHSPFPLPTADELHANVYESYDRLRSIVEGDGPALDRLNAHKAFLSRLRLYENSLNGAARPDRSLEGTPLNLVTETPVHWTWRPYIPAGKIVLVSGDPGTGKSQFALWVAAHVTTGRPLPDSEATTGGGVVYFSNEDGLADTILPRAKAAGCDLSQIVCVQGVNVAPAGSEEKPKVHPFTLADLDVLANAMRGVNIRLIVIDPIQAYMPQGTNMNASNEVREALRGIVPLAEETGATVLILRHRGKKRGDGPGKLSGIGSIDFTGIARSELLTARHPDDPETNVVIHSKSSCARNGKVFSYKIESHTYRSDAGHLIETSHFTYGGPVEIDDEAALSEDDGSSPFDQAKDFVSGVLAEGPILVKDLEAEAKQAGVKSRTLDRARSVLKVRAERRDGKWYAILPGQELPKENP